VSSAYLVAGRAQVGLRALADAFGCGCRSVGDGAAVEVQSAERVCPGGPVPGTVRRCGHQLPGCTRGCTRMLRCLPAG